MGIKILIIDDDEETRKVLRILLKQTGYELLEAADAETAFKLLRAPAEQIGVVICDIKMPEISGVTLLQQIKREFETLPVIVLTGLVDLKVAVEVMRKGAFDFLTKPIKKDDLILVIEKALNYKKVLDDCRELQQEKQKHYKSFNKVIDEMAKNLESNFLQLKKIREDLLKLKGSS
jgi:DNA-binding NtrC family response regulator